MERKLRIANHQITGSRLGFVSPGLSIIAATGPMSGLSFAGETFYKAEYWRRNRYCEWQDKMWPATDRPGPVAVGDVTKVQGGDRKSAESGQSGSGRGGRRGRNSHKKKN